MDRTSDYGSDNRDSNSLRNTRNIMDYKVGDQVLIDLKPRKRYKSGINTNMKLLNHQIATITACDSVNKKVLAQVKGTEVGSTILEVTCSASYTELPFTTINYIRETCKEKGIKTVILEGHYIYREANPFFINFFLLPP